MKTKADVLDLVERFFPNTQARDTWLDYPHPDLNGRTPRSLLDGEEWGPDAVFGLLDSVLGHMGGS